MTTRIVVFLGALTLLAGCASTRDSDVSGASPETSARWSCEQAGGRWSVSNNLCDYSAVKPGPR
jgi:hypothetical protein